MGTYNRAEIRNEFADLLEREMTGDGRPVAAVYRRPAPLAASPAIYVLPAGGMREKGGVGTRVQRGTVRLWVVISVRTSDEDTGWTDEDAYNTLDAVEQLLFDVLSRHYRHDGYWVNAGQAEDADVTLVEVNEGGLFITEKIVLEFSVVR